MAWNPSPKVAAARDFGKKFNQDIVIILHVSKDGQIGYASYGKTRPLCTAARQLADKAFDALIKE